MSSNSPSRLYIKAKRIDSHIDSVKSSINRLVFSGIHKTDENRKKRRVITSLIVLFLLSVLGSFLSPKGKAELAIFYPTACLGGWVNPNNAEGEIQVESNADEKEFNKNNSAILPSTTNADIYCGNFTGSIEENTKPTKILVSLSWSKGESLELEHKIIGDSFASSSGEILDSASTTEVSFTLSSSTEDASSTVPVSLDTEISTTTSTTTKETNEDASLINNIIDKAGELFGNMFNSSNEATTSVPVPSVTEPATVKVEEVPTNEVAPPPQREIPLNENATTSFLDRALERFAGYFIKKVFAEEIASSTGDSINDSQVLSENNSTTTVENEVQMNTSSSSIDTVLASTTNSTSTEGSSTETQASSSVDVVLDSNAEDLSPNNFLEVLYTFDGIVWKSLGKINEASMKYRTFEIPVTATTSWNDINQLQIKVQPVQRIDATPTVYLDGIKVEVLYETPIIHEHPDFARDPILKDKSDDGVRVVSIINSDTNAHEIWYTTIGEQGSYGVAPGTFVQVKLDQESSLYKLIDIYGENIFWLDESKKLLWVTSLQKGTNDGIGLNQNGTTTVSFNKTNGEEWIFEYNNTTKVGVARIKN